MKIITPTIYIILSLLTFEALSSCEDHAFDMKGDASYGYGNAIAFDVSSGFGTNGADSRSSGVPDDEEGLPPMVLSSGSDTLYLHRYVADEIERATGHMAAGSRSAQVDNVADFKTVNEDDGFMVNALYADGSEYFAFSVAMPDELNEAGDIWLPGQTRYWPDGRELHFSAYAPAGARGLMDNFVAGTEKISFDYTVPVSAVSPRADAEMQPDLMFAATDFLHDPKAADCDIAPLNFRHALSAIKFAVRDIAKGEIVDITIKGVAGSGSCVFNPNSTENVFIWSELGGVTEYTQTFNYETTDQYPAIPEAVLISDRMPEKTFILIPQPIPDDAQIEITVNFGGENKILRGKLKTEDIPLWEPGKEYIYTISTSSENWTYVFDVNGSYRNGTEVYMPCPADDIYKEYTAGGGLKNPYFEVVSYRYRTNNPSKQEPLAWTASHGDGVQYFYNRMYGSFEEKDAILYLNRERTESERDAIMADIWISDSKGLYGSGGSEKDKHELAFYPSNVTTDWEGDVVMYQKQPYTGNSEDNPWDLSTFGGQRSRNTANCYVVDREGWYAIPLYYGNAIKDGEPNRGSWATDLPRLEDRESGEFKASYYALNTFKNHKNEELTDGKIPAAYYNSARLLWEDAYGVIDNVKLAEVNGEEMVVFHINKSNLQQGNALIGLSEHPYGSWNKDDAKIVWSWHIWFNEHWLNGNGLSNAFADGGFDTEILTKSNMKNQGDVLVTVPQTSEKIREYFIAPYNVGWCDAKNVRYLSRYSVMVFEQTNTGEKRMLPLIQDGRTIEYKYGNNVYFQFGRKDPFVGFLDHESKVKETYGELDYGTSPQLKSISYSIRNPQWLIVGNSGPINNDWNGEGGWPSWGTTFSEYYNLWNNDARDIIKGKDGSEKIKSMEDDRYYRYQKTIYDPSPAGYTVPPVGFFKILFREEQEEYTFDDVYASTLSALNGYRTEWDPYQFRIFTRRDSQNEFFTLTSTGHRWYCKQTILGHLYMPGDNFNPQYVYLWTNHVTQYVSDRAGFSVAVGQEVGGDNNGKYCISPALSGRKSISRPVRCIRESVEIRN